MVSTLHRTSSKWICSQLRQVHILACGPTPTTSTPLFARAEPHSLAIWAWKSFLSYVLRDASAPAGPAMLSNARVTTMLWLPWLAAGTAVLPPDAVETRASASASTRRISWWWDAPASASDPTVDAMLGFAASNTGIVSSVIMLCGPTTQSGKIAGALSPACARAIPALAKLGVASELWLGETDSHAAAMQLLGDPAGAVGALDALGKEQPGITGFNFDLEVSDSLHCGAVACSQLYASFLRSVRAGLPQQ